MMLCLCGSSKHYDDCCRIYHQNHQLVKSALTLMRSRYCAYAMHNVDYIYETTHPNVRKNFDKQDILAWSKRNKWMGLEIINATTYTVEFKAHYLDENLNNCVHHEQSVFKFLNGKWYFEKGIYP